jgi:subtilisin
MEMAKDAAKEQHKEQQKEQQAPGNGSPRKFTEAPDKRASTATGRAAPRASTERRAVQAAAQRREQYLIAVRSIGSAITPFQAPQSVDAIVDYLKRQEGVEIVARIKPTAAQPFAPNGAFAQEVVVTRIAEGQAESLRAGAQPHIIVERDGLLSMAGGAAIPMRTGVDAQILPLSPVATELSLKIVNERDEPLSRAAVVVYGSGFPVQAVTDEQGGARLILFSGGPASVKAIYVKPAANYWERFIVAPELDDSAPTTIKLRPLVETFPTFPNERAVRWDQRVLQLDRAPDNGLTGVGIRVAIVDSGCSNDHPSLRHITRGKDFTGHRGDDDGWTDDVLGYGTHSAGLIGAATSAGQEGFVGCAPDAELHVFKVFPGGRLSDLLAALDECIAREIDVVSLGIGCDDESELLAQKLREVRHKGIACIVAARTSAAGSGQFPAVLPTVLAVGAVGKLRTFPPDSCHTRAVVPPEMIGNDGVFPAAFTGAGPHIGVSAPGVAVLSTVPGGYAALDGTGVAAALVTGMATLILAHHPLFQGPLKVRSEQRVDALFNLIRASAVPWFADPLRGGAGLPDLQRVPGLYRTAELPSGATGAAGVFNIGLDPPLSARLGPAWATEPSWRILTQMRAAGLF